MTHDDNTSRLPTYFISHGGGPWPWMKKEMGGVYDQLAASLADMPRQIGRTPGAILMVSAHWEAPVFTVQGNPRPPMIYDYGGFPAHTYQVHYDAPGSPELAQRVRALIEAAGLPSGIDAERGYDHGMFSPMAAIYPKADVPVVQLSLKRGLDPAERVAQLIDWSSAPAARIAHPREEHLIPLMVAVGAAEGEQGERVYHESAFMGGIAVSSFRIGAA